MTSRGRKPVWKVCAYCMRRVTERLKRNVCKRCASAGIEA